MSVKAICKIQYDSIEVAGENGETSMRCYVGGPDGGVSFSMGGFAMSASAGTINAAVLAEAQNKAENVLGISFTPVVDSVRLVNPLATL